MSKILIALLGLMLAIPAVAQKKEADIKAIKALIETETQAFFGVNQSAWEASWHQSDYAFWSFADTTDVNSFSGWKNIRQGFAEYFRTAKPSKATIDRQWLDIVIYGNGAYARFIQQVKDDSGRPPQQEVRVLEKVAGLWKIVCVSVIAVEKENQPRR